MKQSRQVKKQTQTERILVLEKMVVRLSLQMNAILRAIHMPSEDDK
jgi:hypothetical protein